MQQDFAGHPDSLTYTPEYLAVLKHLSQQEGGFTVKDYLELSEVQQRGLQVWLGLRGSFEPAAYSWAEVFRENDFFNHHPEIPVEDQLCYFPRPGYNSPSQQSAGVVAQPVIFIKKDHPQLLGSEDGPPEVSSALPRFPSYIAYAEAAKALLGDFYTAAEQHDYNPSGTCVQDNIHPAGAGQNFNNGQSPLLHLTIPKKIKYICLFVAV